MRRLGWLLIFAACTKPAPPAPKTAYRYQVKSVFVKEQPDFPFARARFSIAGRPVGQDSLGAPTDFTVPVEVLLTGKDSPLKLDVLSSCGLQHLDVEVLIDGGRSEAEERKDTDTAPMGHIIPLRVNFNGPFIREAPVFIDNGGGAAKQTVLFGSFGVEAETWAAADVPVGTCDTATVVTLGGKVAGQAAPTGKATLVDVAGGHCYLRQSHIYVREGADPKAAPRPGPAELYPSAPGPHVLHISPVFSVTGMAARLVSDTGQDYEERASLERVPCPKAKAPAKRKKR